MATGSYLAQQSKPLTQEDKDKMMVDVVKSLNFYTRKAIPIPLSLQEKVRSLIGEVVEGFDSEEEALTRNILNYVNDMISRGVDVDHLRLNPDGQIYEGSKSCLDFVSKTPTVIKEFRDILMLDDSDRERHFERYKQESQVSSERLGAICYRMGAIRESMGTAQSEAEAYYYYQLSAKNNYEHGRNAFARAIRTFDRIGLIYEDGTVLSKEDREVEALMISEKLPEYNGPPTYVETEIPADGNVVADELPPEYTQGELPPEYTSDPSASLVVKGGRYR